MVSSEAAWQQAATLWWRQRRVMQRHESDRCHRHRRIVRGIRHKVVTLRREVRGEERRRQPEAGQERAERVRESQRERSAAVRRQCESTAQGKARRRRSRMRASSDGEMEVSFRLANALPVLVHRSHRVVLERTACRARCAHAYFSSSTATPLWSSLR